MKQISLLRRFGLWVPLLNYNSITCTPPPPYASICILGYDNSGNIQWLNMLRNIGRRLIHTCFYATKNTTYFDIIYSPSFDWIKLFIHNTNKCNFDIYKYSLLMNQHQLDTLFLVCLLTVNASTCFERYSPIFRRFCTDDIWCNYVRRRCVDCVQVAVPPQPARIQHTSYARNHTNQQLSRASWRWASNARNM
jgi:hypothetical protein